VILLIEDDGLFRNAMRKILINSGYSVMVAVDGNEGIDKIIKERPQLVLTDYMIPGIDGISMWQTAREKAPDIPAILLTAHITEEVKNLALKSGFFDVFMKPVDFDKLEQAIKQALMLQ